MLFVETKSVRIKIIALTSASAVIKNEPITEIISVKKHKNKIKEKTSDIFLEFSLFCDKSLVDMSITPKSEIMEIIDANESAKVNLPYSKAPIDLAIKITITMPENLAIISAKANQKVFFRIVCFMV